MPSGDRTGPSGMGPMTGRAAGYCAGYPQPGFANPGFGQGYGGRGNGWGRGYRGGRGNGPGRGGGWGRGGGGGWRNQQYPMPPVAPVVPTITREQELNALKQQFEYLETSLNEVKRMIQEMESAKEDES